MSYSRFIDITSSSRNRLTYPNVADFVIPTNSNYQNTPTTAEDPILNAFPYETNLCSGGSTFTQVALAVTSSNIVNFYRGSILNIGAEYRRITAYDNLTKICTVSPGFSVAPPALTLYSIRKELPIELTPGSFQNVTAAASTNLRQVVLPVGFNARSYINNYIFIPGPTAPTSYQWRLIVASGDQLNPPLASNIAIIAQPFYVPVLGKPTFTLIGAGVLFEIIRYSSNNVSPLRYLGTEVGTGNSDCTTVTMTNIVVPNRNVLNGYGGTLANYAFLYVALYSEKTRSYNYPLITNAAVGPEVLFKVPVTYYNDNTFLALISGDMSQHIYFRENDTLHMTVYLPNGEILQYEPDPNEILTNGPGYGSQLFPIQPNPLFQVSAVFAINRG
jgi:hypothetical protein